MPYPVSDIASNFSLYNQVYGRGTVLHDKTANTIRVADGITAYNSLLIVRGRVEVTPVAANLVYAGAVSGAGTSLPTFRALVAADLPVGTGTVTSVGLALPSIFTVSGTPVTNAGTLTGALTTQTANTFFAAPNGATGTPTFRTVLPADLGTGGALNRVLTHDGSGGMAWVAPSTGLTVGTTPVTSGTIGRVFFQGTGNVVQQAANLFYDNTNSRLSVAMGASPGARVDILNTGTTASDLAVRVRDNANTFNQFEVRGNGVVKFAGFTGNGAYIVPYSTPAGFLLTTENLAPNAATLTTPAIFLADTYVSIFAGNSSTSTNRYVVRFSSEYTGTATAWTFTNVGSSIGGSLYCNVGGAGNAGFFITPQSAFCVGAMAYLNNGTNLIRVINGTEPTANVGDTFSMYSKDIVANNAAPHFRTENLDVVRIYSIGGWGTPTNTLTRTTFDTATVTLQQLAERVGALISDLKTGHQLLKA